VCDRDCDLGIPTSYLLARPENLKSLRLLWGSITSSGGPVLYGSRILSLERPLPSIWQVSQDLRGKLPWSAELDWNKVAC
jgi:hypothetical protein